MIPRGARPWLLKDLAQRLGAAWSGDGTQRLERAAPLETADATALAAVYDRRLLDRARTSRAGALVVAEDLAGELEGRALIVSAAPKALFARAIELLHPPVPAAPGIHPSAVVAADADVDPEAAVGPLAVIGSRCRIGKGAVIGAGAVLLDGVVVGEGAEVHPRAVLYPGTRVGSGARIYAGAVLGAPGFGHAQDENGAAVRVPHLGRVVVEAGAEVGANTTVDRATFGETVVGPRARLDNLVQIGHNARVGADAMVAAQSGLSGSSELGARARMGGQSGVADHLRVGDGAAVAAKSAVFSDVPEGAVVAGIPARPIALWRRLVAIEGRLPRLWGRLIRGAGDGGRPGSGGTSGRAHGGEGDDD